MSSPSPDPLFSAFGANVLLKHLDALESEIEGACEAGDIEHIHRMRVASRRLRATLPLFADCFPAKKVDFWLKRIRRVTRSLGQARDLDVQIEAVAEVLREARQPAPRRGLARLILRLTQQRAALQPDVIDELRRVDLADLRHACVERAQTGAGGVIPASLYQHADQQITRCLDEFLMLEPCIFQPEKKDELHQMRIEAKRLRYTLETFAPLYPAELKKPLAAVKKSQELLGDIHDCDVWAGVLPAFILEEIERTQQYFGHTRPFLPLRPGLLYFAENRAELRAAQYQAFLRAWQTWRDELLWDGLRAVIRQPVVDEYQIFPPLRQLEPGGAVEDEDLE